jgi:hypothetical protein
VTTTVPVVLVVFNRPDLTRRTLSAIRAAAPARLFVVADGPRPHRPEDAELTARARAEATRVDWPCEVHQKFSDRNLGCDVNVELGLDWAFSQVDRAIVLEDDCIPHPTFFTYAEQLLHRYRHDDRVWQVAGNSHGVPKSLFQGNSYAFASWASVWGWATWADRWHAHRAVFPRDHGKGLGTEPPVRVGPAEPRAGALVTRAAHRHFVEAATSEDVVTHGWDKHWWITMLATGGLAATPAVNMVGNAGFGADATHSHSPGRREEQVEGMPLPLRHPPTVELDVEVERELELLLNRVGGRAARAARTVVRYPAARRLARRVVNSSIAVHAARTASRLRTRRP